MKKKIVKVKPKVRRKNENIISIKDIKTAPIIVMDKYGELEIVKPKIENSYIYPYCNSTVVFTPMPGPHFYYKCGNCKSELIKDEFERR